MKTGDVGLFCIVEIQYRDRELEDERKGINNVAWRKQANGRAHTEEILPVPYSHLILTTYEWQQQHESYFYNRVTASENIPSDMSCAPSKNSESLLGAFWIARMAKSFFMWTTKTLFRLCGYADYLNLDWAHMSKGTLSHIAVQLVIAIEYKNLSRLWGVDRKIRPKDHCLASLDFPSDARLWRRGTDFSIYSSHQGFWI